jgi:lipopolysaccharide transport system permease protein
MLSKVNFPREAVLIAGLYMVIFNCLIRLILLAGAMAIWRITPGSGIWLFPLAVAGLIVCGTAAGMMLLPVGSLYGDISRSIPIVTQFWMLLTPVVYPARTTGLTGWLVSWNPISPVVTTARESLIDVPFTQLNEFVIVSLVSLVLCFLGLLAFRLVMPLLIERMGG